MSKKTEAVDVVSGIARGLVDTLIDECGGIMLGDAPCVDEARAALFAYIAGLEDFPADAIRWQRCAETIAHDPRWRFDHEPGAAWVGWYAGLPAANGQDTLLECFEVAHSQVWHPYAGGLREPYWSKVRPPADERHDNGCADCGYDEGCGCHPEDPMDRRPFSVPGAPAPWQIRVILNQHAQGAIDEQDAYQQIEALYDLRLTLEERAWELWSEWPAHGWEPRLCEVARSEAARDQWVNTGQPGALLGARYWTVPLYRITEQEAKP